VRKRAKVDSNQAEIVAAYRKRGFRVLSLASLGDGTPDLLVWRGLGHPVRLVEVKRPKGKLTADQERFIAEGWPVTIVRSIADVEAL
jgi:hypothetical protein